jgi:hypothetical protein
MDQGIDKFFITNVNHSPHQKKPAKQLETNNTEISIKD